MPAGNLTWAKEHFAAHVPKYALFKNYYYGNHVIRVSDQIKKAFEMLLGYTRDNLCPLVVDTLSDRLILTGFATQDDTASSMLSAWWDELKMKSRSGTIHFSSGLKGDAYVIVWPDSTNHTLPRIYPQKPENMAVRYEDNGQEEVIIEAVKVWMSRDPGGNPIVRLTRYIGNMVERYYIKELTTGIPDDTSSTYLIPYDLEDGEEAIFAHNMSKVPVFRFCNSLDPEIFAYSELTDVIPHQDIINKALADMVVAEEFHGLPQRWITGLTQPRDPETGKLIQPFKSGGDRVWTVGDDNVNFGEFAAADLAQFINILNDERLEIARISRTPLHLMLLNTGNFPSGEALRTAEAPLIAKVKKRQTHYGDVWTQVMETCLEVAGIIASARITPQWTDASPVGFGEQLDNGAKKKGLGVSTSQLLSEIGYDKEQVLAFQMETDEQAVKTAERAAASFNAGRGV